MVENFFVTLNVLGFTPSWTFIKIGSEFQEFEYRIKPYEIIEYASLLLSKGVNNRLISDLMWSADDTSEMTRCIDALVNTERVNFDIEQRKWILYVLYSFFSRLPALPSNNDLFLLGDLWEYLNRPQNYPWNPIDNEYIKCDDVGKMIEVHKQWILKEVEQLKQITNPA